MDMKFSPDELVSMPHDRVEFDPRAIAEQSQFYDIVVTVTTADGSSTYKIDGWNQGAGTFKAKRTG